MQSYALARLRYIAHCEASDLASAVALALFIAGLVIWASILSTVISV